MARVVVASAAVLPKVRTSARLPACPAGYRHQTHLLLDDCIFGIISYRSLLIEGLNGMQDAIMDTTGAGDAFIGTLLYAICNSMPPEQSLQLAAVVAATKCTAFGARGGLPMRSSLSENLFA